MGSEVSSQHQRQVETATSAKYRPPSAHSLLGTCDGKHSPRGKPHTPVSPHQVGSPRRTALTSSIDVRWESATLEMARKVCKSATSPSFKYYCRSGNLVSVVERHAIERIQTTESPRRHRSPREGRTPLTTSLESGSTCQTVTIPLTQSTSPRGTQRVVIGYNSLLLSLRVIYDAIMDNFWSWTPASAPVSVASALRRYVDLPTSSIDRIVGGVRLMAGRYRRVSDFPSQELLLESTNVNRRLIAPEDFEVVRGVVGRRSRSDYTALVFSLAVWFSRDTEIPLKRRPNHCEDDVTLIVRITSHPVVLFALHTMDVVLATGHH